MTIYAQCCRHFWYNSALAKKLAVNKKNKRRKMKNIKITAVSLAALATIVTGCTENVSKIDLAPNARAAALASGYRPPDAGGSGQTLHIYTWSDYFAPEVLESFERGLGVKVVIDTFESNEAMYAKLKAGAVGYDLITPSSYLIAAMAREKMIDKLDHSKIPNVKKNFDPSFAPQILDPSFQYNVPYAVTYTGFVYAKNKVPAGVDVNSWTILSNPAFKGRVSLLDDMREVIGAGLMYLGYSINSTNPAEIDAAVKKILEWRSNIRKFDSESYKNEVASGAMWLGLGYSTDASQVIVGDEESGSPARDDIGFAIHKEGYTIAFDELVVSSASRNKALAYAFINYIYDGEVAKVNMEYICGPNPVKPGIDALDPDYRKMIVLDAETLKKGQILKGFDDMPKVQELYNAAWDRVKATEVK
jgi:spermidine/putrescine transport system substrate-binding protein